MWFADIGEGIAWSVTAAWALFATVVLAMRRTAIGGLVPPAVRVPVLVGAGSAAGLLVAQAAVVDHVADERVPGFADREVWAWFVDHRAEPFTFLLKGVSVLTDTPGMEVLAIVAAALLWRGRRRPEAAVVLAATVGAVLLIDGFKRLYGRIRPPAAEQLMTETNPALPSGHALGSIVVLGVLAAVVVLATRRALLRVAAVAVAALGVLTIGVSRLYVGVHWLTDVVTGWLLGGAWLAVCVTTLCVLSRRRSASMIAPQARSGQVRLEQAAVGRAEPAA
jgi:membrane-associated phospholipid phosphatase